MLAGASSVFSRYGLFGTVRLCRDVLLTRLFWPGSRLIRNPHYIRGRRHMELGRDFTSGVGLRMDAFGDGPRQIVVGARVQVGDYCHIAAIESVVFGDDVLIASKVFISDHNHGEYSAPSAESSPDVVPYARPLFSKPVVIEKNVWIGESVQILPGVTIGAGSIIGASAVVTRSIPPDSIAVGSPARVTRTFNRDTQRWEAVTEARRSDSHV